MFLLFTMTFLSLELFFQQQPCIMILAQLIVYEPDSMSTQWNNLKSCLQQVR